MSRYVKNHEITLIDGHWYIDNKKIIQWVADREYEDIAMLTLISKYLNKWGVENAFRMFCQTSSYWNDQIVIHWMDELILNIGNALWVEKFKETEGNERTKYREADETYKKYFSVFL